MRDSSLGASVGSPGDERLQREESPELLKPNVARLGFAFGKRNADRSRGSRWHLLDASRAGARQSPHEQTRAARHEHTDASPDKVSQKARARHVFYYVSVRAPLASSVRASNRSSVDRVLPSVFLTQVMP